jgi:hypothetical protein
MNPSSTVSSSLRQDLHWVSVFLRAAFGSLFLIAAISKVPGGIAGTVGYYSSLFEHSLLPHFLVTLHASVIMFVEFALGAWLLSGYRLGLAWKASAVVLLTLAGGMLFAGKYDVASANYLYLALSLGGLVTSRFDRWVLASAAERDADHSSLELGAEHARAH